ncbi:MAG: hypothetical protein J5722_08000 [Oscillospiraceae bacterium]|nr:hypothetical protein [Oscillospiraceae bacterium]
MFRKDGVTYETEEEYMYAMGDDKPEQRNRLSQKECAWLIAVITVLAVLLALLLIPETPPEYLPMLV